MNSNTSEVLRACFNILNWQIADHPLLNVHNKAPKSIIIMKILLFYANAI